MIQVEDARQTAPSGRARDILNAARTCFERYGFHAASMASIAEEARISVGNIYRYFENKEAVVCAIVREDLEDISQELERIAGSPEELADHILGTFQKSRSRQKTVLRLEVMAEGARNPKVAEMVRDLEILIRRRVGAAISHAIATNGDSTPLEAAELEMRVSFVGLLMEGLQLRAFSEGDTLPKGVFAQVRALLIQVFSPPPINLHGAGGAPSG